MAELFKPEIRDVGATNVTAYTPPSIDYSGFIASVPAMLNIGGKEARGPTEGEIERDALDNVAMTLSRVMEIEDPTRKAVEFKKVRLNAIQSYPKYTDQINKVFAEFTGEVYQATGKPLEEIEQANTLKWATDTSEGKAALSYAYLSSGGDQAEAENILKQQYMISTQKQLQIEQAKLASDRLVADTAAKRADFGVRVRPIIQTDIDNKFKMDTSPETFTALTQTAKQQGLDPTVVLLDALTQTRATRLSEITTEINKLGLDPKSENPETFLAQYDARIEALKANQDLFSRSFKNMNSEQIAKFASMIDNPVIAKGMMSGDASVTAFVLDADVNAKDDLVKAVQAGVSVAAGDMAAQTPESVLSNGTVTDSPSAFATQYQNVAPREELIKLFNAKPAWTSSIKLGMDRANTYKGSNESPEMQEATHKALSTMYLVSLPELDKNLEAIKSYNVRTLMSEKMFTVADTLSKVTPLKGKDLYNKMNTYSVNAARNLLESINTNMNILKTTDDMPFVLKMDGNGNINLQVNEVAARTDPTLKKAMGAYRYETRSGGRGITQRQAIEQMPTETDPVKILNNYATLMDITNKNELLDNIEALRILAMQSKKIPIDVRSNGVDTLEYIRQRIQ